MKKIFSLLAIFSIFCGNAIAQKSVSKNHLDAFSQLPAEEIFVHYNTSFLLPGERLHYSLFAIERNTKKLSGISQMAYVELIGANSNQVFKHKLRLENGRAGGEFFMPSEIATGGYKLLAYTQWMLNEPQNFFQADVFVINPFKPMEPEFLVEELNPSGSEESRIESSDFGIALSRDRINSREAVNFEIKNPGLKAGTISVSIRKTDDILETRPISFQPARNTSRQNIELSEENFVLPELRGELLKARLKNASGLPVANQSINVSIPGDIPEVRVPRSNRDGEFFVNLSQPYDGDQMFIQVPGRDEGKLQVEFDKPAPTYSNLSFEKLNYHPNMKEKLQEKHIATQLSLAYENLPDTSSVDIMGKKYFTGGVSTLYDLDDYTRFNSLQETFVEIVLLGRVRRNNEGKREIRIYNLEHATPYNFRPLLVVDGVPVDDHDQFLDYPARKVKSIEIIRDNIFLGSSINQGMVVVETIGRDYIENIPEDKMLQLDFESPATSGTFDFSTPKSERLPDFRWQLLWLPSETISEAGHTYEFSTSDVPGQYEIRVEGITSEGKPVSLRKTFEVMANAQP